MASYKIVWVTFVTVGFACGLPTLDSSLKFDRHDRSSPSVRFAEEYFTPEATDDIPEKHAKLEDCERVTKNSMVCMVCKNPETSAKYEQCSYVSDPSEQTYARTKGIPKYEISPSRVRDSRLFQRDPDERERDAGEEEDLSKPYSSDFYSLKDDDSYEKFPRKYYTSFRDSSSESERLAKKADKDKCREEDKNGMTCMVCTDPDSGGNFEKCSSSYEPRDKIYKFSKSKRFGYPEDKEYKTKKSKKESRGVRRENAEPEESQVIEQKHTSGCREIVKDSMTCTVCKDPRTGDNSEQCSYTYKPDDKLFAYSKSRSIGKPRRESSKSSED